MLPFSGGRNIPASFAVLVSVLVVASIACAQVRGDAPVSNENNPGSSNLRFTVAPGSVFAVPFTLDNKNGSIVRYYINVEGLPPSFQPRIFVNGTEGDRPAVKGGDIQQGVASIQVPWVLLSGAYQGNVSISHDSGGWYVAFNVEVIIPQLSLITGGDVFLKNDGTVACAEGTIENPTAVPATDVTVSVYVDGELSAMQSYQVIAGNSSVLYSLRWPASEGNHEAVIVVESKNGASSSLPVSYEVPEKSSITSETVILVGGILALVFPLVVLAQMGIQRKREKRAVERRERDRDLSSALMTIEEGERER